MAHNTTRRLLSRFATLALFTVAIAIPLGFSACGDDDDPYNPGNGGGANTITVGGTSFSPANKTISVNETITWSFSGGPHTVTQGTAPGVPASPLFDSGNRSSGTFSFTFDTPGTYDYICEVHFGMGMTGTITVQP